MCESFVHMHALFLVTSGDGAAHIHMRIAQLPRGACTLTVRVIQ